MSFIGAPFNSPIAGGMRFAGSTRGRIQGSLVNGVNYPSPFFDVAHTYLPPTMKQLFRWCRYYFLTNPLINATIFKLAQYPVTDIMVESESDALKKQWEKYLQGHLHYRSFQAEVGLDYYTYGNAFISINYPFRKILICPHCQYANEARKLRKYWVFASLHFRLTCPKCGQIGNARVWDHYIKNPSGIRLMRWNPENIEVADNEYSGERYYFYSIPGPIKNDIVIGRKDIVESIPQGWIEAIREQKSLLFPQGGLFHFKRPSLAEENRGWGIPLLLPVLKDTFYLQLMKKAQEAILLEHIVPLRIIFPQAGSGTSDPYTSINLSEWREHVAGELARWRYDQNYIPIMPIPLGNQTIGGDGKALLMTGEMQQISDSILVGMGVPREFIYGGLSFAGTNLSMRMMENFFLDYIGRHDDLLEWVIQQISVFLDWAKVRTRQKPFKMADDLQRRALEFQENQAGLLSDTSYLAGADRDAAEESRLRIKEMALKVNATEKQQLAMAEVQGRVQVLMAKYQAEAQQVTQQAMTAPQAPGEPGGPETAGAGTPGGQEAGALPPGMPPSAPQPPAVAGQPSPMDQAQSPLNAGQQLGSKTAFGADLQSYAMAQAKMIASMDPQIQQLALSNLQAQSPELADLVTQILKGLQKGQQRQGAAGLGVDARPLPEQRAPRRDRASV